MTKKIKGEKKCPGINLPDSTAHKFLGGANGEKIVGLLPTAHYIVVSPVSTTSKKLEEDMLNLECEYRRVLGFAVSKETGLPLVLVPGWHQSRHIVYLAHQEDFAALCDGRKCFSYWAQAPMMDTMFVHNLPDSAQAAVRRAHEKNVIENWLSDVDSEKLLPARLVKKVKPLMPGYAKSCAASLKHAIDEAKASLDERGEPIEQIAAFILLSDSRVLLDVPPEIVRVQVKKKNRALFNWLCLELKETLEGGAL